MTGYPVRWVQEIARHYRAGPAASGDRRQANSGAAPLLTTTPPEQVRQVLAGPAPDGGGWRCRSVARWMRQTRGRPVREQRGGEGMRRLGFTPQRPPAPIQRQDPWL